MFCCSVRVTKNAASLAKRLKTAQNMKLILYEELSSMEKAKSEALAELKKLAEATSELPPSFVEQVASTSPAWQLHLDPAARTIKQRPKFTMP